MSNWPEPPHNFETSSKNKKKQSISVKGKQEFWRSDAMEPIK